MVDQVAVRRAVRDLLRAVGENPEREGLLETPHRVARHWAEFMEYDPGKLGTTFEQVQQADQMVVVKGMRVWSLCEHHLLPFWCDISVGYIANGTVLGLSKFARIAHKYAHRLQLQEQLVRQIADEIAEVCDTGDVAVVASGEHLCMTMRGIQTPATMISSATHGIFRDSAEARAEFLSLVTP